MGGLVGNWLPVTLPTAHANCQQLADEPPKTQRCRRLNAARSTVILSHSCHMERPGAASRWGAARNSSRYRFEPHLPLESKMQVRVVESLQKPPSTPPGDTASLPPSCCRPYLILVSPSARPDRQKGTRSPFLLSLACSNGLGLTPFAFFALSLSLCLFASLPPLSSRHISFSFGLFQPNSEISNLQSPILNPHF